MAEGLVVKYDHVFVALALALFLYVNYLHNSSKRGIDYPSAMIKMSSYIRMKMKR